MAVIKVKVHAFVMHRRAFSIMGDTVTELKPESFSTTFVKTFWIGGKIRREGLFLVKALADNLGVVWMNILCGQERG